MGESVKYVLHTQAFGTEDADDHLRYHEGVARRHAQRLGVPPQDIQRIVTLNFGLGFVTIYWCYER